MTHLPRDQEVAEQLSRVRLDVLSATHRVRSPRRSTRFRVTRNLAIGAVAIGALTAGTVAVATAPSQYLDTFSVCYEEADLSSQHFDVLEDHTDPITACSASWRVGQLGQNGSADPNDANFPVPELAACELRNGVAAVFPREDAESDQGLCEALGLAVWDSD